MSVRRGLTLVEVVGALALVVAGSAWATRAVVDAQQMQARMLRLRGAARLVEIAVASQARSACTGSPARTVSWRTFRGTVSSTVSAGTARVSGWLTDGAGDTLRAQRTLWCE